MDLSLLLVFIVIVRIGGSGEMVITARNKQENSVNTQSATESIVVVAECGEQLGDNLGVSSSVLRLLDVLSRIPLLLSRMNLRGILILRRAGIL